MPPSNRANRPARGVAFPGLLLAFLLVWFARGPALAADALPPPRDDDVHYERCLGEARSAPARGLAAAEDWRNAGGGFPAEHCAAVALFGLKRYAEAARRFETLAGAMMERGPALRAGALEQAGQAWLLAGKPVEATSAFDAALRFTPDDPDLLIDRAQADDAGLRFSEAVADLDAALALAPRRADALVYRASAYRQLGQLDHARADVEAALALAPEDTGGLLERGNIRRLDGDAAGAAADWHGVVRLAPGSPAAQAASANLTRLAAEAKPAK